MQGTAKIEQFVKLEKKEGDDDNRRSEQSTSTEMLTVPLPTEEPHSSHQEKSNTSQQLFKTYVTVECHKSRKLVVNEKCFILLFLLWK